MDRSEEVAVIFSGRFRSTRGETGINTGLILRKDA
jgi:hypothetical protein